MDEQKKTKPDVNMAEAVYFDRDNKEMKNKKLINRLTAYYEKYQESADTKNKSE